MLDLALFLAVLGGPFGAGATVGNFERHIDILRDRAAGPQDVERMVARHGYKPADRAGITGDVAVGALPDLHIDLLNGLFGLRAVLQDTQGYPEEFRAGAFVERAKCGTIAQGTAGDEIGDILRRGRT